MFKHCKTAYILWSRLRFVLWKVYKRCYCRVDFNVPLKESTITNNQRYVCIENYLQILLEYISKFFMLTIDL